MIVPHKRHAQFEPGLRGARDGFGLSALFRGDAGIGAGGIDQRDHRQSETVGHVEQALGLAIALGHCGAEIVLHARCGVVAFLLAHHSDGASAEAAKARDHGAILAIRDGRRPAA